MKVLNRNYNIGRILKLRQKIRQDTDLLGFLGSLAHGRAFDELVRATIRVLPAGMQRPAVEDSLKLWAGQPVTETMLDELSWRLAANTDQLRRGRPAMPWLRQEVDEWLPVHFLLANREFSPRRKPLIRYTILIMAGTPAGLKIEKVWPQALLPILARRLGFTQSQGPQPYLHHRQIVGLRCKVLISAELSRQAPSFDRIQAQQPPSLLEWNRTVLGWRQRHNWPCPYAFPWPEHPCHLCHVGLDECQAATHLKTYVKRLCVGCQQVQFFEPDQHSPYCLSCIARGAAEGE